MSEHIPSFYARLGLSLDSDERTIKRTYARILKTIDPDSQAVEFERLRLDYSQALDYVQNPDREYYFDDREFVFKSSKSDFSTADTLTKTDESVHLDVDSTTTIKAGIQKKILKNTQDCARGTDHEVIRSVYDEALSEFQEFCKLTSNPIILTLTNSEYAELLRNFLQRDALVAFEARMHFENLLIEALARRDFGTKSGRLLISCAAFFNWNTADSSKLMNCGDAGREVRFLLDNFFGLTDIAQLQLIRMADVPDPEIAYRIVSQLVSFQTAHPKLTTYFLDVECINAWKNAKKNAPLSRKMAHVYSIFRGGFRAISPWHLAWILYISFKIIGYYSSK